MNMNGLKGRHGLRPLKPMSLSSWTKCVIGQVRKGGSRRFEKVRDGAGSCEKVLEGAGTLWSWLQVQDLGEFWDAQKSAGHEIEGGTTYL
jgi:hypothetical protein